MILMKILFTLSKNDTKVVDNILPNKLFLKFLEHYNILHVILNLNKCLKNLFSNITHYK